jgi:choline kinase
MRKPRTNEFITTPRPGPNAKRSEPISVILLAENHGYRMKSYGPISLVVVDGKTLIERQIEAISSAFLDFEVIVCSGFETAKIYNFIKKRFGRSVKIRIVENQVYFHSNCCESIRLCMNNVMTDSLIICGGGVLLTPQYLRSVDLKKPSMLYQNPQSDSEFDIGVIENAGKLENLSLAIDDKCWTELTYLTGYNLIQSFYNLISNPEYKNKFLFEAINAWPSRRQISTRFNEHYPIVKINNIKMLRRINEE